MAFLTTQDLLRGALEKSGEPTNGNSKFKSQALDLLNQSYLAILSGASKFDFAFGEPWPWSIEENPLCITLLPAFIDGQINLTEDSAAGVFTVAPVLSMKDRHVKITSRQESIKVIAHTAGETAFTLECPFPGVTQGYDFEAFKFIYDLGTDILRLAGPIRSSRGGRNLRTSRDGVYSADINGFKTSYPISRLGRGTPDRFTVLFQDDNVFKVMLNASVIEKTLMFVDYVRIPAALIDDPGSTVKLPLQNKRVLEYMTASEVYFNHKKNSVQGSIMLNLAKASIKAMQEGSNRDRSNSGKNRARLVPRRGRSRLLGDSSRARFIR